MYNEYDYYSPVSEERRKQIIDELNGDKPGISPKLVKIAIASVCVAGLIMLIGKIFG